MKEIYFYREENFENDVCKFIKELPEYLKDICYELGLISISCTYEPASLWQPEEFNEKISIYGSSSMVFVFEGNRYDVDPYALMQMLPQEVYIEWEYSPNCFPNRLISTDISVHLTYWIADNGLYMRINSQDY